MSLPMESNPLMVTNLVNNQSQCAAAKTAGDWVCFSRLQPRQVDVDEGGKNGRQVVGR